MVFEKPRDLISRDPRHWQFRQFIDAEKINAVGCMVCN
jgi:hypothetical protein